MLGIVRQRAKLNYKASEHYLSLSFLDLSLWNHHFLSHKEIFKCRKSHLKCDLLGSRTTMIMCGIIIKQSNSLLHKHRVITVCFGNASAVLTYKQNTLYIILLNTLHCWTWTSVYQLLQIMFLGYWISFVMRNLLNACTKLPIIFLSGQIWAFNWISLKWQTRHWIILVRHYRKTLAQ